MILLTKQQVAEILGLKQKSMEAFFSTYKKRGKLNFTGNKIDVNDPLNKQLIDQGLRKYKKTCIKDNEKECIKCHLIKDKTEFSIQNNKRGIRISTKCIICENAQKAKTIENKRIYKLQYSERNKEVIKRRSKEFYVLNKACISIKIKERTINNKIKRCVICSCEKPIKEFLIVKSKRTKACVDCKEKYSQYQKDKSKLREQRKREKNKAKIQERIKRYCTSESYKRRRNTQIAERRKNDPLFKLTCAMRKVLYQAFKRKGYLKDSRTHQIIGCDFEHLKHHIESQFKKGMSWENHGLWHIDHIMPMATAETKEDMIALNHYTNLQPLWAYENLSKGDRVIKNPM